MPSEQRLHPASILFAFGRSLKALALPGLLALIAGRSDRSVGAEVWMMLLLIPAMLHAVARYLSFRVRYESTELVIRSGILFRNIRHVPYARIQNLEAVRNPVHRLLGVVEVRVENAAGKEPEATISVLPIGAFEEMRRRVLEGRTAAAPAAPGAARERAETHEDQPALETRDDSAASPAPCTLLQLSLRDLLLCGFIENRGMVVIGAIYGFLWEFGPVSSYFGTLFEESGPGAVRETLRALSDGRLPPPDRLAVALVGVLAFLLLVRIASMGWALVRLHGFKLTRAGEDLRTEFGLFTRVTATIPLPRVQTITIRERPLHRRFQRVSVRVETAGSPQADGRGGSVERDWVAPILRRSELPALLQHLSPGLDVEHASWQPVHPRAFRRAVKPALVLSVVVTAGIAALVGPNGLLAWPLVAAWLVIGAWQHVKHLGWSETGDVVLFRSGWLWRAVTIVRIAKIQAVSVRESPFDRRTRMARLRVDTAGAGERSHRVDVPYLPVDVALDLHRRLALAAAGTDFRW